MNPTDIYPTYTLEQALAMLPDKPMIETRYETVPNCGITHVMRAPREQIVALLREVSEKSAIFESGPDGRKLGFNFHFEVKNHKDGSRGNLFIQTREPN